MYDDEGQVTGITTKINLDESVSINRLLDYIWQTYDKDGNESIDKEEAK